MPYAYATQSLTHTNGVWRDRSWSGRSPDEVDVHTYTSRGLLLATPRHHEVRSSHLHITRCITSHTYTSWGVEHVISAPSSQRFIFTYLIRFTKSTHAQMVCRSPSHPHFRGLDTNPSEKNSYIQGPILIHAMSYEWYDAGVTGHHTILTWDTGHQIILHTTKPSTWLHIHNLTYYGHQREVGSQFSSIFLSSCSNHFPLAKSNILVFFSWFRFVDHNVG